jgi:hypothetical protein
MCAGSRVPSHSASVAVAHVVPAELGEHRAGALEHLAGFRIELEGGGQPISLDEGPAHRLGEPVRAQWSVDPHHLRDQ